MPDCQNCGGGRSGEGALLTLDAWGAEKHILIAVPLCQECARFLADKELRVGITLNEALETD